MPKRQKGTAPLGAAEVEEDSLVQAEKEAEKENDEAWKPTQERLSEKRREVSKEEAATALERLLAKAEKYTQFLNVSTNLSPTKHLKSTHTVKIDPFTMWRLAEVNGRYGECEP